jgi:hypothetical protein
MAGDFIIEFIGNAMSELIVKSVPLQRSREFSAVPLDLLARRNRGLYFSMLSAGIASFVLPFMLPLLLKPILLVPVKPERIGWIFGMMFGLPFSTMLMFLLCVWAALGRKRVNELIFYFETRQQISIYVFYFLGALLAPLGIVSVVLLCR